MPHYHLSKCVARSGCLQHRHHGVPQTVERDFVRLALAFSTLPGGGVILGASRHQSGRNEDLLGEGFAQRSTSFLCHRREAGEDKSFWIISAG